MLGFEHRTQTSSWSLRSRVRGLRLHLQLLASASDLLKVVMLHGGSRFLLKYLAAYWYPELIIACEHPDARLCWIGLQHYDELFDSSASSLGA
jgi:hypothetical protein